MGVLDGEAPIVRFLIGIDIVVHNKQSGVGLFQNTEPQVKRPQIDVAVVLNKSLEINARSK